MRILLVFEERYGTLMDAVRISFRRHRPYAEVRITTPEALEEETYRFEPDLLVCGQPPAPEHPTNQVPAFIELFMEPSQPARFRVEQRRWESINPGIEELLSALNEAERLVDEPPPPP